MVEFRVQEEHARPFLRPDDGTVLGDPEINALFGPLVRKLVLDVSDPRYAEVGAIAKRMFEEEDDYFYHGWDIHRYYSTQEIESAELLEMIPTSMFEPDGESCGTVYDYSDACPLCGAGRVQKSDLILDLRKAPKTRDIAATIGSELIVSQKMAELFADHNVTGVNLRPVRHKARYIDDAFDFTRYAQGREILRLAQEAGYPHPDWSFTVWINRPEQADLLAKFDEERIASAERRASNRGSTLPVWYQVVVDSHPVSITDATEFGVKPFIYDPRDDTRCPLGHVLGLSILSELYLERSSWNGSDFNSTRQLVGVRRGALVPRPFILISQRLNRLLKKIKLKGYKVEVAHLD